MTGTLGRAVNANNSSQITYIVHHESQDIEPSQIMSKDIAAIFAPLMLNPTLRVSVPRERG